MKAIDPLYQVPVVIFSWRNLGKEVYIPRLVAKPQIIFGYKSVAKYFYWGLFMEININWVTIRHVFPFISWQTKTQISQIFSKILSTVRVKVIKLYVCCQTQTHLYTSLTSLLQDHLSKILWTFLTKFPNKLSNRLHKWI